jgi:hypothetical protein
MRNEAGVSRWDAFAPSELQALDEFFRSFGPMRDSSPDIAKMGREITAIIALRRIPAFASVDSSNRGYSR